MVAAVIEVAADVFLELETVDDEGRRGLRFCRRLFIALVFFLGRFDVLGLGVLKDKNETRAVWRPFEIVAALNGFRDADGLAAEAIRQPDLTLVLLASRMDVEAIDFGAP